LLQRTEINPNWKHLQLDVMSGISGGHFAEHPADEFPIGVYDITASSQAFAVKVRSGVQLSSSLVTSHLPAGTEAVTVLEVKFNEPDNKVRALIESPAGWISLLDTRNGFRWAENRGQFCKTNAPHCTTYSSIKCELRGGECLPKGLTLTVDTGFLEDEEFPLGTYDIVEEARVQVGAHLDSQVLYQFGILEIGETVTVLKTQFVPNETRVRAQVEQKPKGLVGWISLVDTSDNFRWAENRAAFCAKQTEWWCWWASHKCYNQEGACYAHAYPVKMS